MAMRSMIGMRKGGSPVVPDTGDDTDSDAIGAPPTTGEPATCPNCQCVFDPESGEIVAPPADGQADGAGGGGGGGVPADLMAQLAASMG